MDFLLTCMEEDLYCWQGLSYLKINSAKFQFVHFSQLPFLVSWTMVATASQKWVIYLGRAIAGVGDGAMFSLLVAYISEIATVDKRGNTC